jgi:cytochrome c553
MMKLLSIARSCAKWPFAMWAFAISGVLLSSAAGAAEGAQNAPAAGSAEAGKAKATPCTACHGDNGNSVNPVWPTLAGQHPLYIVKQLKAFKNDERTDPLMTPMAKMLSDADMDDLAAFFSAQSPTGLEAEPSKISEGQRLYRGGEPVNGIAACAACHGPAGAGNPAARYPSIRSQHSAYVVAQLKAYRSGTRKTDQPQNQMMRNVAAKLSDVQIEAVASYVQGLR